MKNKLMEIISGLRGYLNKNTPKRVMRTDTNTFNTEKNSKTILTPKDSSEKLKSKLYIQLDEYKTISTFIDKFDDKNSDKWILRNNEIIKVPLLELKAGDILLERESKYPNQDFYYNTLNYLYSSKIEKHNLLLKDPYDENKIFIKLGEVKEVQKMNKDYGYDLKINYKNSLADYAADYMLVERETKDYSSKKIFYYEKKLLNDRIFNSIFQNDLLEQSISAILKQNNLQPGEKYKFLDLITTDNNNLNNQILYVETKEKEIKSFEIGTPFEHVTYQQGEIVRLEDLLKNSLKLIDKAYTKQLEIEKQRLISIKRDISIELGIDFDSKKTQHVVAIDKQTNKTVILELRTENKNINLYQEGKQIGLLDNVLLENRYQMIRNAPEISNIKEIIKKEIREMNSNQITKIGDEIIKKSYGHNHERETNALER